MRTLRFTSLLALLAAVFGAAQTARAASAAGTYQFTMTGDKYLKYVEVDAQTLADGTTSGYIYMTDQADIVIQDVDGSGEPRQKFAGYSFKADVDGLVVDRNQAVVSATIRTASNELLLGRRVLLTLADNGDNTRVPDQLTWGVYNDIKRGWVPSDAEWKEDPGVGLRWWATDAERREDVGYQMPRDESTRTSTFPIAAYGFVDASDGVGDLKVSP